mgnify:FL=1|jgi:hypothetical protein
MWLIHRMRGCAAPHRPWTWAPSGRRRNECPRRLHRSRYRSRPVHVVDPKTCQRSRAAGHARLKGHILNPRPARPNFKTIAQPRKILRSSSGLSVFHAKFYFSSSSHNLSIIGFNSAHSAAVTRRGKSARKRSAVGIICSIKARPFWVGMIFTWR